LNNKAPFNLSISKYKNNPNTIYPISEINLGARSG
jgi:hypothetical protein